MSRGYPSMTALLGLLAIAGYQNRDKLSEMLSGLGKGTTASSSQGGLGGLLGQLGGSGGGATPGSFLGEGLRELVDRFKQSGQGATADSWVGTGPNQQIAPPKLEEAIGPDVLETNRIVAGTIGCTVVPRITGRCRQVHTAGTAPHVGRAAPDF